MNSAELVTTEMSASLCSTLMFVGVFVFVCGDQKITVAYGRNITLTCRAANDNIDIVEWIRADLKGEYVLLYRDEHFNQHPSFKNRVDLKDRQMKDGDVSLILKNVTINDAGKYECHVVQGGTNRRKRSNLDCDPISIIHLSVVDPPGQPGGSVGLIVGLSISAGILVAFVFLLYRKYKPQNRHFI